MSSRITNHRLPAARRAPLVALPALLLAAAGAMAGEPVAGGRDALATADINLFPAETLAALGQGEFHVVSAFMLDEALASPDADAPAYELAEGLGVQVEQSRRAFRARALDWVTDRSIAMGHMADFFTGGADSGWHLTVDLRGDDEVQLQWKARFR